MTVTMLAKSAVYWIGNILVGKPITIPLAPYPAATNSNNDWSLQPGVYTPRQIVQGFAPLLDTVVHHLTPDSSARPPRAQLLDNIAAILSTESRESSLPFPTQIPDHSRREIRDQASRIGKDLVKWANESARDAFNPDLNFRSRCEGHLLTPDNVGLLFGRRSTPHLMQLFNEYMHQMVLLRDSLLPFQNYEDVLIPVSGKARGMRHMEGAREKFMASLFTKQVTQASVVTMAKTLLATDLPNTSTGGYGFQYAHGIVIPALFTSGQTLHLLQYAPAQIDPARSEILFDYEFEDYYTARRVEIAPGTTSSSPVSFPETNKIRVETATLGFLGSDADSKSVRRLQLGLNFNNGQCAAVDVGQIARGWRYSYAAGEPGRLDSAQILHAGHELLQQPGSGLISAEKGGFHVIAAEEKIVALALLGRLYPENIVRLSGTDGVDKAVNAGKGFEPKFVVWG